MVLAAIGQVQWGDLGTWAAAIFTGAAFAVALVLLGLQRRDLNDREEDRRKDQARHVAAWCTGIDTSPGERISTVRVQFQNSSEEPVYDTTVFVKSTWGRGASIAQGPLGVVSPGMVGDANVQASLHTSDPPLSDVVRNYPPILITFRDATGQWWIRDEHGALSATPDRPAVIAS